MGCSTEDIETCICWQLIEPVKTAVKLEAYRPSYGPTVHVLLCPDMCVWCQTWGGDSGMI